MNRISCSVWLFMFWGVACSISCTITAVSCSISLQQNTDLKTLFFREQKTVTFDKHRQIYNTKISSVVSVFHLT